MSKPGVTVAKPPKSVVERSHCPDCGEPYKAKVDSATGKPLSFCLCAQVQEEKRRAVQARAVIREGEGWTLIALEMPESVAKQYAKGVEGPHTADVAVAKLDEWISRMAMGANKA